MRMTGCESKEWMSCDHGVTALITRHLVSCLMLSRIVSPVSASGCRSLTRLLATSTSSGPAVKKKAFKITAKDVFVARRCPRSMCVVDEECMELIVKSLCPAPSEETAVVVECSPGPGFLTKQLLKSGIPHIHMFEHHDSDYLPLLQRLVTENKDRLSLTTSSYYVIDPLRHLRIGLPDLVKREADQYMNTWKGEPPAKVFVSIPPFVDRDFLHGMMLDLSRRDGVFASGRCQFLLMTTFYPLSHMSATKADPYYGYLSVMAQSMFDLEVKGSVPLRTVIPLLPRSRKSTPESPHLDIDKLYIYSMTPKASLIDEIPFDCWNDYRFFVKQAMLRKSGYVIPFFERYFPNSGPRLIESGVPLYSRFLELTPKNFIRIFNECISWPEYNTSTFKMASASFADESDEEEEEEDGTVEASHESGSQKLVSDVFA